MGATHIAPGLPAGADDRLEQIPGQGLLRRVLANSRGPFWATFGWGTPRPAGSRRRSLAAFSVVVEETS